MTSFSLSFRLDELLFVITNISYLFLGGVVGEINTLPNWAKI